MNIQIGAENPRKIHGILGFSLIFTKIIRDEQLNVHMKSWLLTSEQVMLDSFVYSRLYEL